MRLLIVSVLRWGDLMRSILVLWYRVLFWAEMQEFHVSLSALSRFPIILGEGMLTLLIDLFRIGMLIELFEMGILLVA